MKLKTLSEGEDPGALVAKVISSWLEKHGVSFAPYDEYPWSYVFWLNDVELEIEKDGTISIARNEEPHHQMYVDLHDPDSFSKIAEYVKKYAGIDTGSL